MFCDDLEIVPFEDGEVGDHGFVDCLGESGEEFRGATFEEVDSNERHGRY